MERLLDYVQRSTARLPPSRRITDWAGVQKRMGESAQTMNNWRNRSGLSKQGALKAQELFGCSANWLLDGEGPESSGDWPFPRVDRARWLACGPEDRGYVQAAINRALDECEASRDSPAGKQRLPAAA